MLYWIAEACKEAREEAGRLQVHVAAGLNRNQSAIARFEDHENQPRNIDATVEAYAEDLEIDPRQLWARALELWLASEQPGADEAAAAVQVAADAVRDRARSDRQSGEARASSATKPAAE